MGRKRYSSPDMYGNHIIISHDVLHSVRLMSFFCLVQERSGILQDWYAVDLSWQSSGGAENTHAWPLGRPRWSDAELKKIFVCFVVSEEHGTHNYSSSSV